jgi:L-histidine N-alpha-methyltransferase
VSTLASRYHVDVHVDDELLRSALADDARRGLTERPRSLPPRYFYDGVGSALFERITRLPEYYLTRAERQIIDTWAPEVIGSVRPREIVELGSGSATKLRALLAAAGRPAADVERYVPMDVDAGTVVAAARALTDRYPFLHVHGVVGDFERHLPHVPSPVGRRLVLFLGSTIGNLDPVPRRALLRAVRRLLGPSDRFLLGVDLKKDRAVLEAAYNDGAGITAAFNRNILRVVNRGLGADFRPDAFEHRARWDATASRIEMHLAPDTPQTVRLSALGLTIELVPGETIWTESSYKFTRESTRTDLAHAGLTLERWQTDRDGLFALALAAPA